MPPQHVGLGTKTALMLAMLEAVTRSHGLSLPAATLQELSRRGGASGVGIHSYFQGGFVVDGGHDARKRNQVLPSSAVHGGDIPPLLHRARIPSCWLFHLLLPDGISISGNIEREIFRQHTPIPKIEVWESISWLYHGAIPAVLTSDLGLLRSTLIRLHAVGFKARELAAQSDSVREVLVKLSEVKKCAAGMSSLGPLVYAVTREDDHRARNAIHDIATSTRSLFLGTFPGKNDGRKVEP